MALDVGTKRIGVAITDPLRILARPLQCLHRIDPEADARRLAQLAHEHEVRKLIVGLPARLNGAPTPLAAEAEILCGRIEALSGVPWTFSDERLSSKEAEALLADKGFSVRDRRRRRDEVAAALILQWHLQECGGT